VPTFVGPSQQPINIDQLTGFSIGHLTLDAIDSKRAHGVSVQAVTIEVLPTIVTGNSHHTHLTACGLPLMIRISKQKLAWSEGASEGGLAGWSVGASC
jgi:hypothetical protein